MSSAGWSSMASTQRSPMHWATSSARAPRSVCSTSTKGRQIEAGLEQSFLDERAQWTVAGYRIVKENLLAPDPVNPGTSLQIGQQSSRGVEATTSLMPPAIEPAAVVSSPSTESRTRLRGTRNRLPLPERASHVWPSGSRPSFTREGTRPENVELLE